MRDLEAYSQHRRNNPRDEQQMREHPYDFVSLPDRPETVTAPGHDCYPAQLYSGELTLRYRTLTPLHVGSGVFESSERCGLAGGDQPVRGIIRCAGRPILPGSSWKGAVRSRYEAITRSRLALANDYHKLAFEKVPKVLQGGQSRDHEVRITDERLRRLRARMVKSERDPADNQRQLQALSPAESLFGTMGYRGRVHSKDGTITGPPSDLPLRIVPMESPAGHRLAKPGESANPQENLVIEVREVEGRKFYYDGDLVSGRSNGEGNGASLIYEVVDYVPKGSEIRMDLHLEVLNLAELGALLICSGHGGAAGVLRFGGFKPAGLGKVELVCAEARLRKGMDTRSWKGADPAPLDFEEAIRVAYQSLIDPAALEELRAITTLKRP